MYCDDPCSLLIIWSLDGPPRPMGPGAVHRFHTRSATTGAVAMKNIWCYRYLMLQISKSIFKIRQWSLFSSHRKNWFTAHCKYMHLIKKNSQYTCYLERYSRFCEFCFGLHVCDWIISYSCFNVNISGTRWNYWETEKAILSFFENTFR